MLFLWMRGHEREGSYLVLPFIAIYGIEFDPRDCVGEPNLRSEVVDLSGFRGEIGQ